MVIKTIQWLGQFNGSLRIIDQSALPARLRYLTYRESRGVVQAIRLLKIRGAPALGIVTAYGIFLGIRNLKVNDFARFYQALDKTCLTFLRTRPTAVNLGWAIARIKKVVRDHRVESIPAIKQAILQEAHQIFNEDGLISLRLGRYGVRLIRNGDGILTHCNTGALATGHYGTALAAIYQAQKQGKKFTVYVTETRPLLQGARLTTWELMQAGIKPTLICDNMAGHLMNEGKVDKIMVGADRITALGHTANKIGTYQLAVLAHHHQIPFYVVAPGSSFDLSIKRGSEITIEYRRPEEVLCFNRSYIAPRHIKVFNPAFDLTPAEYITAFVTEHGLIYPPYASNIPRCLNKTGIRHFNRDFKRP